MPRELRKDEGTRSVGQRMSVAESSKNFMNQRLRSRQLKERRLIKMMKGVAAVLRRKVNRKESL